MIHVPIVWSNKIVGPLHHQHVKPTIILLSNTFVNESKSSIPPWSAPVWHSGRFEHWLHVLPSGALREREGGGSCLGADCPLTHTSLLGCYQVRALDVAEVSDSEMIDDQVLERGIRLEGPLSCTVPGDLFWKMKSLWKRRWRWCLYLFWLCSRVYIAFSVEEKELWWKQSSKLQCLKVVTTAALFSRLLDPGEEYSNEGCNN